VSASFTPGPWRHASNAYGCQFVQHGDTGLICGGNNHDTLQEVNARLIAAAPDLYGALSYYAEQFCEFGASNEGCGKFSEDVCSGCKARAALAKATGA